MDIIYEAYTHSINEMAKPTSNHLAKRYYHGTSTHKNAKGIIKSGKIKVPDLSDRTGSLKPIDGMVYMTPDKSYAQIYALGADVIGSTFFDNNTKDDKYGFIFVINNKDLVDILPDEDSIGELIYQVYKKKPSHWLIKMALCYLDVDPMDLGYDEYEDDPYIEDKTVFDLVVDGDYDAWAIAGKELIDHLNDKQLIDIIDLGVHISNKGSVSFSEVWRLEKIKAKELKANGSNLEKLVDKDKTGKKFIKDL